MKHYPMTQEEFIILLEEVLKEKRKKIDFDKSQIKYIKPYDNIYDKCLLGYEVSYAKKIYPENTFNFKITKDGKLEIEASAHLKSAIEKLVKLYGKKEVTNVLKDM